MSAIEQIKMQIKSLYETNPIIHMDINLSYPKLSLKNEEVTITGIYSHLFQIEETREGIPSRHTIKYTDLITQSVVIKELQAK